MRIPVIAALAALGSVATAGGASGDTWCYRDFGEAKPRFCSFFSARQCLDVARIAGGICEREQVSDARPASTAKAAKKAAR